VKTILLKLSIIVKSIEKVIKEKNMLKSGEKIIRKI
jgi:hypothetical protein